VLVVDDELPIRMLLARMLKSWGYAVWHVGSADEAIQVMSTDPADIVLADVRMPDRDGVWLAAEIHARWPHTPVIMTTGVQDAEVVQASRRNGATAYVTKPFVPYLLRDAVDSAALRWRRGLRDGVGSSPRERVQPL
jgi:CheY-like chemotaxis protein